MGPRDVVGVLAARLPPLVARVVVVADETEKAQALEALSKSIKRLFRQGIVFVFVVFVFAGKQTMGNNSNECVVVAYLLVLLFIVIGVSRSDRNRTDPVRLSLGLDIIISLMAQTRNKMSEQDR